MREMTPTEQKTIENKVTSTTMLLEFIGEMMDAMNGALTYLESGDPDLDVKEKNECIENLKEYIARATVFFQSESNEPPSYPAWDESIRTGSWRGLCEKCGKRQRYYHEPTKRLFALCAVCGADAINTFLGGKIL